MKTNYKSAGLGFALGLAVAAAAAQAAQHDQPSIAGTAQQQTQRAPMGNMQMMGDPAMRQQMMERMRGCRDMMTNMMDHMQRMPQMQHQPPQPRRP